MNQHSNNPPDFTVRNSIVVLVIIAIVFLCMLASIFEYNTNLGTSGYIIVAALAPVIGYFIIKKTKTAIIRINKDGIFSNGRLITDWKHFQSAKTDQLPLALGDPRDKVVLIIFFYNAYRDRLLEQQLPLHNTYNKSEEQILAAIELFREI